MGGRLLGCAFNAISTAYGHAAGLGHLREPAEPVVFFIRYHDVQTNGLRIEHTSRLLYTLFRYFFLHVQVYAPLAEVLAWTAGQISGAAMDLEQLLWDTEVPRASIEFTDCVDRTY